MENIIHIVHNISEEDLTDIVDEVFEDANFETIVDNENALSEDDGYNSDQSEDQSEDTKCKIVYPEKVMAMNMLTKQCVIYTSCVTRLTNIEHIYNMRKHVIRSHAVIDGKHCSEYRNL